jgi:penicillin-binding protein 1C
MRRLSLSSKILAIGFAFYLGGQQFSYYWQTPVFNKIKSSYQPSDILVLDQNDFPLNRMRTSHQQRSLDWLGAQEISPVLRTLMIQSEDQRFFQHLGVDFMALAHALWQNLFQQNPRGGSTISMQVIKLLHGKKIQRRHSILGKVKQIMQALALELKWSKEEILEAYTNLLPIRGEILGIKAASFTFFNKAPLALNDRESALLIALIRSPNADATLVARRSCKILPSIDCGEIQRFATEVLNSPTPITRDRSRLPIFSKNIIESRTLGTIKTTLDVRIQEIALTALREQLLDLKIKNVKDGAVLVLDTKTGRTLAYVGNAGPPWTELYHIDGLQADRQLGSTIKPFLYATAFDLKILELNSLVEDSKADIPIEGGVVYHPQNYDHTFRGLVSAGEALASSLNVPAVRTLLLVGQNQVTSKLRQLGFLSLKSDEYYGPSLALGTLDASLWQLTHAYRNLAQSSVFSAKTRAMIFSALSVPEYRRFTFGLDSTLNLPFAAAVKTGTSKDMRDNWCLGWTERYTVGVWVGNFNGQPMWNVSGMTGAAPIWRKVMLALHSDSNSHPENHQTPAYLTTQTPLVQKTLSRISYPVANMILAYDQDIPKPMQKISLEIENPQKGQKLFLNGKLLTQAGRTYLWPLQRGHFQLSLKSNSDNSIDEIQFEVR